MISHLRKLRNALRYLDEAEQMKTEYMERGREEANKKFKTLIERYNQRVSDLTEDSIRMDEKIRKLHEERINNIETRWTSRCDACKDYIEEERKRLRKTQNILSAYLRDFTDVFNLLYKHAVFVENEHDTILKATARVRNSKTALEDIKTEANEIINKVEPLLKIRDESFEWENDPVESVKSENN